MEIKWINGISNICNGVKQGYIGSTKTKIEQLYFSSKSEVEIKSPNRQTAEICFENKIKR
jgi:hypothetical protein